MAVKLLIADDDALARALIEAIVERDGELELIGSAEDADGSIELAGEHQPDVAVLDWVMPGGGGPAEFTFDWQMSNTQRTDYATHWHQCMLVQLHGGLTANIVRSVP